MNSFHFYYLAQRFNWVCLFGIYMYSKSLPAFQRHFPFLFWYKMCIHEIHGKEKRKRKNEFTWSCIIKMTSSNLLIEMLAAVFTSFSVFPLKKSTEVICKIFNTANFSGWDPLSCIHHQTEHISLQSTTSLLYNLNHHIKIESQQDLPETPGTSNFCPCQPLQKQPKATFSCSNFQSNLGWTFQENSMMLFASEVQIRAWFVGLA